GPDRRGGLPLPGRVPFRTAGGVAAALAVAAAAAAGGVATAGAEGRPQVRVGLAARRLAAGGAYPRAGRRCRATPARRAGAPCHALRPAGPGYGAGTAARRGLRSDPGVAALSAVLHHHD